jgi:ParB-like nuclease domain
MTLTVEHVPSESLRPYPHNPRNGDTDAIIESIRINGLYKPLVVSADGVILAGNHTYAAAMEMGIETLPIVRVPYAAESNEAARIVLADNRTSDRAKYDDGVLAELLGSLEEDGLYGTAFTSDDLDDLLARLSENDRTPLDLSGASNISTEPTLAERAAAYESMGRRLIVLDYDQATYAEVTEALTTLRSKYDTESNADLLRAMIADLL